MTTPNVAIVRNFYENVRRGDIAAATAVFADELNWLEPPFPGHEGGTFRGKANILANVLEPFIATWRDLTVTPERISDAGEMVIVHGRYAGRHKDTGRPFEARFVHTWTLREGLCTHFEMLADTIQMFRTVQPTKAGTATVSSTAVTVSGVEIFYREAGPAGAPTILLLHGFPSSSHMFRDLIPALADKYHVLAPDYPGFGLSGMPDPKDFACTFDNLARTIADWTDAIGLESCVLYLQDYGAPVGFRLASARPERIRGLVIQNGNIYREGLSENLAPLTTYMTNPTPETEAPVRGLLTLETTKFQYTHGASRPTEIDPAFWIYDQYFLDRPGNDQVQLALFRDYKTNPPLYEAWQNYLRTHQPPVLVAWGKNDPFFTPAGATSFARDVPTAEIHLLDSGHFALADHATEIAGLMQEFLRKVELGRRLDG
jgi:pimeloyl-ACP methyl ester carboxylesterase/ketosteroid isomerase-like protein